MPHKAATVSGEIGVHPKLKILLMEDSPTDAELAIDHLVEDGFTFKWSRVQTQSALAAALADFDPDILLCDNNLPGTDGSSAVRFVRERRPHLPIVIVTGTLDDERAVALVKAGANDYVRKDRLVRLPLAVRFAPENERQRHKQAESEAAALTSELRYRRRFEKAAHGILVAHAATHIIYDVNQSLGDLLGYSRDEFVGKTLEDFNLLRMENGEELPISSMVQTGDSYECTLPFSTKDGRSIDLEFVAVTFQAGTESTIQCNMKDVTIRRYLEAELKRKNRDLEAASLAKDHFLASMSHELRTPLNGIIGFTGALLMRLPGELTTEQERQLQTIAKCSDHLLSLINDLLNLAKLGSGSVDLRDEQVDVTKLLMEDVAPSLAPRAISKGLKFEVKAPSSEVVIMTTNRALWQIVTNLTTNAIKFTSTGRVSLELNTFMTDEYRQVDIEVADTGVGIRPEDREKLFLPFSRIDDAATRHEEGSGLGLHICQKLASLIGARITVASEYGKGSRFTVTLRDHNLS
jgi:protein-histidine pros-kinase